METEKEGDQEGEKMISYEEWKELKRKEKLLKEAAKAVNVQEEHLPRTIKRFLKEIGEMKRKLKGIKQQ